MESGGGERTEGLRAFQLPGNSSCSRATWMELTCLALSSSPDITMNRCSFFKRLAALPLPFLFHFFHGGVSCHALKEGASGGARRLGGGDKSRCNIYLNDVKESENTAADGGFPYYCAFLGLTLLIRFLHRLWR